MSKKDKNKKIDKKIWLSIVALVLILVIIIGLAVYYYSQNKEKKEENTLAYTDLIKEIGKTLSDEYLKMGDNIWVHKSVVIAPTAFIGSPCIIGPNSEIRHCAFIRNSALIGANCVVGNSTELKNVILFDNVQVPHYNYVGDSILGYKAHMGAGSITSNVRSDGKNVKIEGVDSKLMKVGAMLGDRAEIGCGSVLNPGAIVGRNSIVYPLSSVRGSVPSNSIYKREGVVVKRRDS